MRKSKAELLDYRRKRRMATPKLTGEKWLDDIFGTLNKLRRIRKTNPELEGDMS